MKKRVFGRKFSRGQGARRALLRSLVRALVAYGSIKTTRAKAKTAQKEVERLVNLAKARNISTQRHLYARLGNDRETTKAILEKVVPMFEKRMGGYTRIINLPRRRGDAAELAKLEWTEEIEKSDKRQAISNKSRKRNKKEDKPDKKGKTQNALKKIKTLRKKKSEDGKK